MPTDNERTALRAKVLNPVDLDFDTTAIRLFQYQAKNNPVYKKYLHLLKKNPKNISDIKDIPFLPISFFKTHLIKTGRWRAEAIFKSSGTTGAINSRHFIRDLDLYRQNAVMAFTHAYAPPEEYCFVALLPSYLERKNASLVYMVDFFIKMSKYADSGFFLHNTDKLIEILHKNTKLNIPTVLLGVSFALWDLAEAAPMDLSAITIMETGGMKGRRKEIIRSQLHEILNTAFHTKKIHSEYGMTELLSQAYSKGNGIFHPAPTMRLLTRSLTDPFEILPYGKSGAVNIIDLANIDSCAFIATDDIGKVYHDNSFEILGRTDVSDIRGCNLMTAE